MALLVTDGLQVEALTTGRRLLEGVSISVEQGTMTMIVGQSGSGKSLTLRAILGMLHEDTFAVRGQIQFDGKEIDLRHRSRDRDSCAQSMGMIFQDPGAHLNPLMTIEEHMTEVFELREGRRPSAEYSHRVREMLAKMRFADPERIASAYPHQLSGGQKQRAMIALALAVSPKLLIADEPTSALDAMVQREIMDLLDQQRVETGLTVLMVTHDIGLAFGLAQKIYVMNGGRISDSFDPGALDPSLAKPETRRLTISVPPSPTGPDSKVGAPAVIRTEGLSKTFATSDVAALEPISLDISRGSVVAIVGESGSGKTTLGRLLVGLLPPTSGRFTVTARRSTKTARTKAIQMIFQDPATALDPERPVRELLIETMKVNHVAGSESERRDRAVALLEQVGLPCSVLDAKPMSLSGGERQRVAIARALCAEPEVLICDESVSALDSHIQREVIRLMSNLRRDLGLTIIFITHDLRLAQNFADEIVVLKNGQLVEAGPAEAVFANPSSNYTKELLAAMYPLPHDM
jgi:peptide/nickel transport system ATP-binding protein